MATPKTVSFYTLGCKLNFSETSSIGRLFEDKGYTCVDFNQGADITVINTCSVTEFADRKCKKVVKKALKLSPEAKIVIIGCYAQLKPDEIANIEGVDLVLGAAEKFRVIDYVDNLEKVHGKGILKAGEVSEANVFHSSFSFGDRTRSFLKIQDGCNYKCTFCTIPQARGKSRSDTLEQVVENANILATKGIKEIVLTGVNIGDFGNGTEVIEGKRPKKEALFIDLIKELDKVDHIERFRISSIEPNLLTEEIIDFVSASDKFMPHFHIPLQSGSNKQLKEMQRRYKRELYSDRVKYVKSVMPHACIGVDVIVGFPGETDDDFLETYQFIESMDVSYLHVFTYSERANTPAADREDQIPLNKRRKRSEMLRGLSEVKKSHFYEKFLGQTRQVLIEGSTKNNMLSGFTDNYIKVSLPQKEEMLNQIIPVKLGSINPDQVVESTVDENK